jgi:hypothetical protein
MREGELVARVHQAVDRAREAGDLAASGRESSGEHLEAPTGEDMAGLVAWANGLQDAVTVIAVEVEKLAVALEERSAADENS